MKTAHAVRFMDRPYLNLPNAATRKEVLHLLIDRLLVGACCLGLTTALLFLLTLS